MKLTGFKIANYKSIGSDGIELKDFNKINILIGKNNSGKSNILNAIYLLKSLYLNEKKLKQAIPDHDYHKLALDKLLKFKLTFALSSEDIQANQDFFKDTGLEELFVGREKKGTVLFFIISCCTYLQPIQASCYRNIWPILHYSPSQ